MNLLHARSKHELSSKKSLSNKSALLFIHKTVSCFAIICFACKRQSHQKQKTAIVTESTENILFTEVHRVRAHEVLTRTETFIVLVCCSRLLLSASLLPLTKKMKLPGPDNGSTRE